MSISLKGKIRWGFVSLILFVGFQVRGYTADPPISGLSWLISDTTFTAGVAVDNDDTLGQITIFISPSPHALGETLNLALKDSLGNVIIGGISPTSVVITSSCPLFGASSCQEVPITLFSAGPSGLQLEASIAGSTTVTPITKSITVLPNIPNKLFVLTPEMAIPTLQSHPTVTAAPQDVGAEFQLRIRLTDQWYNLIDTSNDAISFGLPLDNFLHLTNPPTHLSGGITVATATITAPKVTETLLVTDTDQIPHTIGSLDVNSNGPPEKEVFAGPSPFNPKNPPDCHAPISGKGISFQYRMTASENATLKVTDQFGQKVWEKSQSAANGYNYECWDGKNDKGEIVAAGVYYIMLDVGGSIKSKKRFGVVK